MKKELFILLFVSTILAGCNSSDKSEGKMLLKLGENLYEGTMDEESIGPMGDSGCIGGVIESSVGREEVPKKEGQSNFGCVGNSYTAEDDTGIIQVYIEGEWYTFKKVDNQ